jgi:hypothetical protein
MPYRTSTDLLAEFRADWEAALCPDVGDFLVRCEPGELDAFRDLLDAYLMEAPSPPYSPIQQRRLAEKVQPILDRAFADPAYVAAEDQRKAEWRDLPWVVKRWRRLRFAALTFRLRWQARQRPNPWD